MPQVFANYMKLHEKKTKSKLKNEITKEKQKTTTVASPMIFSNKKPTTSTVAAPIIISNTRENSITNEQRNNNTIIMDIAKNNPNITTESTGYYSDKMPHMTNNMHPIIIILPCMMFASVIIFMLSKHIRRRKTREN